MLRITKAEDQAMRLAMRLAAAQGQMTLAELARQENLPEPMVAKLLGMLRRGGVVAAVRGRHGGYELAASADRISAAEVLRCVGADPVRLSCAGGRRGRAGAGAGRGETEGDCPREADCGLRTVWRLLQHQVGQILQGTSLSDLLLAEAESRQRLQRLWELEPVELETPRGGRRERRAGAGRHGAAGAAREGAES